MKLGHSRSRCPAETELCRGCSNKKHDGQCEKENVENVENEILKSCSIMIVSIIC
jgi:hypothetical protein